MEDYACILHPPRPTGKGRGAGPASLPLLRAAKPQLGSQSTLWGPPRLESAKGSTPGPSKKHGEQGHVQTMCGETGQWRPYSPFLSRWLFRSVPRNRAHLPLDPPTNIAYMPVSAWRQQQHFLPARAVLI